MARVSIPNVLLVLSLTISGPPACGSAVFYEEVPDPDADEAAWTERRRFSPGPAFEDGRACARSVAVARVHVLGEIEIATSNRERSRQRCLADAAQLLATLHHLMEEEDASAELTAAACVEARSLVEDASRCE